MRCISPRPNHNSRYKEAASWDVGDAELAGRIEAFYADEREQLGFMNEKLA